MAWRATRTITTGGLCLDTEALFQFVYATQAKAWEKLKLQRSKDERADIRKHVGDYVRLYAFLSQVITFGDASLEKFYQFTRHLLRKLKLPDDPLPPEITKNINMDSYRIQQTSSGTIKLMHEDGQLKPISALGTGRPQQEDPAPREPDHRIHQRSLRDGFHECGQGEVLRREHGPPA